MSGTPNDQPNIIEGLRPVFDGTVYHLQNINALPYAAAEYLGIPRADVQDMLAVSNNSPLVERTLEILSIVAQAQSESPNGLYLNFRRIKGELMRAIHERRQDPDDVQLTVVADTNIPKPDYDGPDPAWTGAIVATKSHGELANEFLFAIVGSDTEQQNPLAAGKATVVFADEALMAPERKMRELQTYTRMANELHDERAMTSPPDQFVPTITREIVEQSTLFGKPVDAKTYGGQNA
jgi:hypothetical protein